MGGVREMHRNQVSAEERAARERQKQRVRVERRKRLGRLGEVMYDRRIVSGVLQCPYEPDWSNLKPAAMPQSRAMAEASQDQLLRPIQDQYFGGIYVSSDSEETLDDLDKKYKHLSIGYRNYTKQKKRLGADRTPGSQQST